MEIAYDGEDEVTLSLSVVEYTIIREMLRELPRFIPDYELKLLIGGTPDEIEQLSLEAAVKANALNIPF